MKRSLLSVMLLLCAVIGASAQTTLEQCYDAARDNYPLIAQRGLIRQSEEYSLKNASTAYLPQFGLSAKAAYQSDVTNVPIPTIKPLPKDQYQFMAQVNQSVWDGGIVSAQKNGIRSDAEANEKRLEVDLYTLEDRVNSLFFGVLILEEQLIINTLLDEELRRNLTKVESYVSGGLANSADMDAVRVEILNNRQNRAAIESSREAYLGMLSAMVGFKVDMLVKPQKVEFNTEVNSRPELEMFEAQIRSVDSQRDMLMARSMPKLGLFAQGAYGNPGLNMFKSGFTTYAVGGVNLSWNFSSLYTNKRDYAKIDVQKRSIEVQRETFLYNTDLQVRQINGDVERLTRQMREDDEIIALRGNIKRAAEAKVEGGTMTVTDMLREVTAENGAIRAKALHEIELLMQVYSIRNKMNN